MVIGRVIDRFESKVLPVWPQLRAQVVHGDLILENVILDEESGIKGIIDFGDLVHSSLLQDVSAALASILRKRQGEDVLKTIRIYLDGYTMHVPLEPIELELLGPALCARLAAIVTLGTWHVARDPRQGARFNDLVEDSWRLLVRLDAGGSEALELGLGAPLKHEPSRLLRARRDRVLGPALADLFYEPPVHAVRGEGVWLTDVEGRRLLDGYNNVATVGHCHPRVTEAVVDQTRRLNTHSRYLYDALFHLAERLVEGLAENYGLDTVMVVNSGSEANDLAWRIATTWTGAEGAVVSDCAYHGMTTAASDLSPQQWPVNYQPSNVERFKPAAASDNGDLYPISNSVGAAIERLKKRNIDPAAIFFECGFISDGIVTPSPSDLVRASTIARAANALVVVDEVQMGHARSGSHLWSFQHFGLKPDLLTLGKPMGNGYPVAAVITRAEIAERFGQTTYFFSTFGGNPVAARAALAVLDVIDDEALLEHTSKTGKLLRSAIEALMSRHDAIGDVRGQGLLVGVELVDPTRVRTPALIAETVVNELRNRGVLIGRTGPRNHVLKIRPPLIFGERNVSQLVETLDSVLRSVTANT